MTTRSRFIVAYDIREPRRLRQTHQTLKNYGEPLQYSVFVCDMSPVERIGLERDLSDVINAAVDSVVFIDLGPASSRGTECMEFMGSREPLPVDGAATIV